MTIRELNNNPASSSRARTAVIRFVHHNPRLHWFASRLSDIELADAFDELTANLDNGLPVLPPAGLVREASSSGGGLDGWQFLMDEVKGNFANGLSPNQYGFLTVGLVWLTLLEESMQERILLEAQSKKPEEGRPSS